MSASETGAEHYGKVVETHFGGVDLTLYIVAYSKEQRHLVRCIDQHGTPYTLPINRVKGTGERKSKTWMDSAIAKHIFRFREKSGQKNGA